MTYEDLGDAVFRLGPKILSQLLFFLVVGVHWSFHRVTLARMLRIDGTVVALDLMLPLLVTFMPSQPS